MIIKKDSWHFKLQDFFYSFRADDLCTYIRRSVILGISLPVALAVIIGIISLIGQCFLIMIGYIESTSSIDTSSFIFGFAVGIPFLASIITIVVIIFDMLESKFAIYRPYTEPKGPGIIKTYLKSKSENYCTRVEYKD